MVPTLELGLLIQIWLFSPIGDHLVGVLILNALIFAVYNN